ncbi:CLM5 protein, partial [Origma solitaria]|nr:CLM5 protein [Origma solitaria]
LTLPGLQGQAPEAERRREGGTLYIQCPYAAQTKDWQTKYWCRLIGQGCQEILQTHSGHRQQSRDRKITMQDNTTSRIVSITMTDLTAEDSGSYQCAYYASGYLHFTKMISLNVFKAHVLGVFQGPSSTQPRNQAVSLSNANTFIILSVVLLALLILALVTSVTLGVRHYKLLGRTGNRGAEDTGDRAEGTAQPGSTGRRESSQDDSKGPAYINLDVQSPPTPQDPLYCNVEPSQAHRNPQSVDYAVIAFNQSPRNDRG